MRKNTLFVSVLLGFGALAGGYSLLNSPSEAQYEARISEKNVKNDYNTEYLTAMRTNVNTGKVEASDYLKAIRESEAIKGKTSTMGLNWEFIGPDNIGGRARSIVVDKDDDQLLYCGAAAGGMYVSKNAGGTWEYKSGNWENIQVSTVVQDASGKLYAGTDFTQMQRQLLIMVLHFQEVGYGLVMIKEILGQDFNPRFHYQTHQASNGLT